MLFERLISSLLRLGNVQQVAQLLRALWHVMQSVTIDDEVNKARSAAGSLLCRTAALPTLTNEAFFIDQDGVDPTLASDLVLLSCSGISATPFPQRQQQLVLVLSTPMLWERLARIPADGTPHICLQRLGELFTFSLDDSSLPSTVAILNDHAKGRSRWAWLLGNLASFVSRMIQAPTANLAQLPIWLSWLSWCKLHSPAAVRDDHFSSQLSIVHGAELARALLRCIDQLDSQHLLPVVLQLYFPVSAGEETNVEPPMELLQVLAFGTPIVEKLFPSIVTIADNPNIDLMNNIDFAQRLRAFSFVYTVQLQSMYDAEFFGPTNPLRPHDVARVVPALNRIAFKIVTEQAMKKREAMSGLGAPLSPTFQLLRRALTGLVRALYYRHLRKPILDDSNAFRIPEARRLLESAPVVDLGTDEVPVSEPMDDGEDDEPSPQQAPTRARIPARLGGDSSAREILEAVLEDLPHVLPFQDRVALLHNVILLDQENRPDTRGPWMGYAMRQHKIRRNFLVEDGFAAFLDQEDEHSLRSVFKVEFISPNGEAESGIDGGGLFKEFMIVICRETFDPKFGLFAVTDDQTLYPSPSAFRTHSNAAELYKFLGKVVGKAVYEMTLLEAQFSRVFLNRILGRTNEVDDVAALDKELHHNMLRLKENDRIEDLGLTFSISTHHLGHVDDVDLIPNGRNIPVTRANLTQYLHVVANFRTNLQLQRHTAAFVQGLQCVIPLAWLKMFDPYELNMLISGSSTGFDVQDLFRHTNYGGGYNERSQVIQWLWAILQELQPEDKGRFLMFVTSCSRPPLLGFKTLYPQFGIHLVPDYTRLPTASTCANLLKLPNYQSCDTLKQKLLEAIRSECGFDLS